MAVIPVTCPHCNLGEGSFRIIGQKIWPIEKHEVDKSHSYCNGIFTVGAMCPRCCAPVGATVVRTKRTTHEEQKQYGKELVDDPNDINTLNYAVIDTWPKALEPRIPAHLHASTENAFLQAERAFARGDADAAGMMYRRALETALKLEFPQVTGTLFARIEALVRSHDLPPAIGDWAHEVRAIGNDAAHDTEPLSHDDMHATRNFVDAVLRYAISLPKEIEIRRSPSEPPDNSGGGT